MRAICIWDGSEAGLIALETVLPLLKKKSFEHIEIMMLIWPARDSAMWTEIYAEQLVYDDLHRAAATVSTRYAAKLRALVEQLTSSSNVSRIDAETVPAIRAAVPRIGAELVLVVVGHVDPDGIVGRNLMGIVAESIVPIWILHGRSTP
jgi:hypothetical protein